MKVCNTCGNECNGRDGDNHCTDCKCGKKTSRKRANDNRKARDSAMQSLGLVRVRGALGGTYWE